MKLKYVGKLDQNVCRTGTFLYIVLTIFVMSHPLVPFMAQVPEIDTCKLLQSSLQYYVFLLNNYLH